MTPADLRTSGKYAALGQLDGSRVDVAVAVVDRVLIDQAGHRNVAIHAALDAVAALEGEPTAVPRLPIAAIVKAAVDAAMAELGIPA